MGVGTIIVVLMPGEDRPGIVLWPTLGLFGLMIVLAFVERMRHREEHKREFARIMKDEWTLRGMNRALSFAFRAVIFSQVPMMFFMAYVPETPSVAGMGVGTVAFGCATWAASFLYHTRENPDG